MSEVYAASAAEFSQARPWALPDFGAGANEPAQAAPLHTARHLDELESAAHAEGYARGEQDGYAAGMAQARELAAKLDALLQHLARPLAEVDAETERALVALTIEMARRLAHLEMDLDPTRVASVVREAVSALGATPRDVRVHLHPLDAAAVRGALATNEDASAWKLLADHELNRGDCRIVAEGAQVDARLDTRQAELAQQLLGEDA